VGLHATDQPIQSSRAFGGLLPEAESPVVNFKARGYGKPTVLSFHSGACSGCGSEFAACGTWNGRVGATQRVETGAAPLSSPTSERSVAVMRKASIRLAGSLSSSFVLRTS
jgi:hypothetical protein